MTAQLSSDLKTVRRGTPLRQISSSPFTAIALFAIVLVVLGIVVRRSDWLLQGSMALTLAIAATGLGLALGLAGEFVLGVSVIFAAGAYTAAVLTTKAQWDFWPAALVGMVVAIIVGALLSLPGLRVGHFYFGMLGFFLVFLIPAIVQIFEPFTNGSEGLSVPLVPSLFGTRLTHSGMFLLAAAGLILALLISLNIRRSPLAIHMRRLRDNPVALETSGVKGWKVRLATYVLCSMLAGLGGAIYSHLSGFLQPAEFGLETTNLILAAVIVGGSRSLLGPSIGVIVLYILPRVVINAEGYADIVYGFIVLLSILLFRGGVVQSVRDVVAWTRKRRYGRSASGEGVQTIARSSEGLADLIWGLRRPGIKSRTISARGVRKRYGGVAALDFGDDDVVGVASGEVHLLLGPNGSGKTSLLNVLTGLVKVDAGKVTVDDDDVTGWAASRIARGGVSRSFQGPTLPDEVSPVELFAASIAQLDRVSYLHWLTGDRIAGRTRRRAHVLAERIAREAGLGKAGDEECRGLTSGQRRIVDVTLSMISSNSTIVLLDEPAAGLSDVERQQLARTIRALASRGIGFLVVEHDLDLALGLADRVTVMASGRPVAAGTPAEIKESPIVREVLIGGTSK